MTKPSKERVSRFVVRFSNYEPAEIDSYHITEAEADKRVEELDSDMWEVEEMLL